MEHGKPCSICIETTGLLPEGLEMYKRVLLKISGEALSGPDAPLCAETIEQTAGMLVTLQKKGVELGVVVGGGNIMRGRSAGKMERNRADHMGMLATTINCLALLDAVERLGGTGTVLSAVEMPKVCDPYSSRAAHAALKEGKIVIFAGGSGCPFFSTDTAAALRAAEIGADVLLLAKNVDAIYTADPKTHPDAKPIRRISYREVIEQQLKATDLTAITLCREQKIPIHAFALDRILDVFDGAETGTVIVEE